jgi:hypothetical protein
MDSGKLSIGLSAANAPMLCNHKPDGCGEKIKIMMALFLNNRSKK